MPDPETPVDAEAPPVIDYTTDATAAGATEPVPEAPPEPEAPVAPVTEPDGVDGFEVKRWNGMPLYQCTSCPFDTLDIGAARAHAAPKPAPTNSERAARAGVVLTDRYGNPKE